MGITYLDYIIFFLFVLGVFAFGISFYRKSHTGEDFTSARGKLPPWAVGMSIFATYVSSISFLGLPGDAYAGNWNPFVFSLSIPIASFLAAKIFIPLYRGINSISAYQLLEDRIGYWARCYASICYLSTQIARIGSILLLLALPINAMFGWDIALIVIGTGIVTLIFTMLGGISAVIWTDTVQGIVLIAGAILCAVIITISMPEGIEQVLTIGTEYNKFSLGSFSPDITSATFWVVLIYGLFVNIQNYGIDQNYIQRYKTTSSTKDAIASTLFGSLLYIPVSLLFVYIGTALFCYYKAEPGLLPTDIKNDMVFPFFITNGLPTGLTGLIIASIFSAGVSTISTSINSSATIIHTDFISRIKKKSDIKTLRISSFVVGAIGIIIGILMINANGVLDAWWKLSSIFSGGMLGLFLLIITFGKVKHSIAVISVALGVLVIAWMTLSPLINEGSPFYQFTSPIHTYLTIVIGTSVIFISGFLSIVIKRNFTKK